MDLLFDLDGTLIDPRRGILGCFRHALGELRVKPPAGGDLERLIGPPLRAYDVARGTGEWHVLRRLLWGFGSREELVSAGPDVVCDAPGTLVSILLGWKFTSRRSSA